MLSKEKLEANAETQAHRENVRRYLRIIAVELLKRGEVHDDSKMQEDEIEYFAKYTPRLKGITYNSPEYKKCLEEIKPALDHHYAKNRHHPEHFVNGIKGMTLIDLVEMLTDWFASSQRHSDGNILKSIAHNKERFSMSDDLVAILENTANDIDLENASRK
jgi:hypothetical protein